MILWLQYAACKASAVLFGFVAKASEKPYHVTQFVLDQRIYVVLVFQYYKGSMSTQDIFDFATATIRQP